MKCSRGTLRVVTVVAALLGMFIETPISHACVQGAVYGRFSGQVGAIGAHASWTLRALRANHTDVISNAGFTAQVLWVGTHSGDFDDRGDWVELGATQGWQGVNRYTYYTSEGTSGAYDLYSEHQITQIQPRYGQSHRFGVSAEPGAAGYTATIDGVAYWTFEDQAPPTVSFGVGLESTCADNGGTRVNRTDVTEAAFNIGTEPVWLDPPTERLISYGGDRATHARWCGASFAASDLMYWMRSALETRTCRPPPRSLPRTLGLQPTFAGSRVPSTRSLAGGPWPFGRTLAAGPRVRPPLTRPQVERLVARRLRGPVRITSVSRGPLAWGTEQLHSEASTTPSRAPWVVSARGFFVGRHVPPGTPVVTGRSGEFVVDGASGTIITMTIRRSDFSQG